MNMISLSISSSRPATARSALDDVKRLDQIRTEEQQRRAEQKKADSQPAKSSGNRFNNFTQREYDYSQLEKQLLGHS